MHDLDRTQLESAEEYETNGFEFEGFDTESDEYFSAELEAPLDEVEEMELASQLLEVSDEQELDQFMGGLVKRFSKLAKSPIGRNLAGILKQAAKKALPVLGGAVGTYFGGPLGAKFGSQLATRAGSMLGLELEGLSPQDQEFEVARQIVKFADAAVKSAAAAPANAPASAVVKRAVTQAAQQYAPGLLRGAGAGSGMANAGGRSGRWLRKGRTIVLFGA